ncbi:MAG TPA: hypothetical protein VHD62_10920 [Opitutaceae bacterium]|nr:hypothetical protein [Opitutaceae bacterium]
MPAREFQGDSDTAERLARLEARLARIEAQLGVAATEPVTANAAADRAAPALAANDTRSADLELEVGQHWFAMAGVIVLTLGAAFLLSLPFAGLPAGAPSLAAYAVVGGLFALAHAWRRTFELVASYVRGAAMALMFFATLRLCFPLSHRVLEIDAWPARGLLIAVVAANLRIALRRRSPWLAAIAFATGGLAIAVTGAHWLAFGGLVALASVAVYVSERENWRGLSLGAMAGGYLAYLAWALGPLFRGQALHFEISAAVAPAMLLACAIVFAAGRWWQPREEAETAWDSVHALANCTLGYGVFFVHTLAAFPDGIAPAHTAAFAVFLGLAAAFWLRRQSRGPTFLYAMTGYAALSVAILKASALPEVFVWLSVQSVVVVATAVWFRSRFIVVANFLIYLAIVIGYMILAERETGISVGFGIVALVSARILHWQQDRLELKTDLMRNAYLFAAFIVFPYALYHLVPVRFAGLAWIALALGYYALSAIGRNRKYRWMGHATLLLATLFIIAAGTRQFEPAYRVLSFLVLGTVLLVVSLVFTRVRKRTAARNT